VAIAWLLAATVIWGSTFFAVKSGIAGISRAIEAARPGAGASGPAVFVLFRFAIAAALLAVFPGAARELAKSRRALADAALIALPFAAGFGLQVYGLVETTATVSAFLTSTYVLFVPAIGAIATRRLPPGRLQAGAAVVTAGIVLLTFYGRPRVPGARGPEVAFGRGELLSLLCAIAFAVQVHMTDVYSRRTSAAALTLGSLVITCALTALALGLTEAGRAALAPAALRAVAASPGGAITIGYTASFATALAFYIMYRYQRAVSPARATLIYAVEPAAAALFAWLFAGEGLTALGLAGCLLIVVGNLVAELRK
jgi:drug/metabolite transporter (DMT)-like permease